MLSPVNPQPRQGINPLTVWAHNSKPWQVRLPGKVNSSLMDKRECPCSGGVNLFVSVVNNNVDSLVTDRKVRRTQEVIQIITSVSGSPGKASPDSTELPTIAPALGNFAFTHSLICLSAVSGSNVPCDVCSHAHTCNSSL